MFIREGGAGERRTDFLATLFLTERRAFALPIRFRKHFVQLYSNISKILCVTILKYFKNTLCNYTQIFQKYFVQLYSNISKILCVTLCNYTQIFQKYFVQLYSNISKILCVTILKYFKNTLYNYTQIFRKYFM